MAIARERIQYLDAHGKLVTESLRDFTRINLAKAIRIARCLFAGLEQR